MYLLIRYTHGQTASKNLCRQNIHTSFPPHFSHMTAGVYRYNVSVKSNLRGVGNTVTDIIHVRWKHMASVSVVTIVGVFSLVSPAVVTIHPRASTKTRAQVNAYRRTRPQFSNRVDRTHTYTTWYVRHRGGFWDVESRGWTRDIGEES